MTSEGGDGEPFFDGNTLYFDRLIDVRDLGGYVWYETYKAPYDPIHNVVGTPVRLDSLVGEFPVVFNNGPRIVGDGNTMLFTHGISGTWDMHIWIATRNAVTGDWGDLTNPDWAIKTAGAQFNPWYCEATRTLYFVRDDECLYQSVANRKPVADAGPDQTVAVASDTAEVRLDGRGSYDADGDSLTFEWSVPDGVTLDDIHSATPTGVFPVGPTSVTLTVSDGYGGVATDSVLITVLKDVTPPVVSCTPDKPMLWPPDHQVEQVTVSLWASDNAASENQLQVAATAKSSEPDDARGDGCFVGDVNGQDAFAQPVPFTLTFDANAGCYVGTVALRCERDATQNGRVYSIVCTVVDLACNRSTARCVVVVPHDRGKR